MKKVFTLVLVFAAMLPFKVSAQQISASGQIGWAVPQGTAFEDSNGDKMTKGGISLDFDVLYHFGQFDNKLAAGITYNTSFLFGAGSNDNTGLDIGLYGLNLYGVKGYYKFFKTAVSPYGALSLGLSQLSTPQISDGSGNVISKAERASSFGMKPEIGIQLGGFLISVGYVVPMKYEIAGSGKISAGSLQISIGGRFNLFSL